MSIIEPVATSRFPGFPSTLVRGVALQNSVLLVREKARRMYKPAEMQTDGFTASISILEWKRSIAAFNHKPRFSDG
ncbi:hypothetical protein Pla22_32110 [Rubripirellula amarantea]|uniref:Uncharacterized protein n=1 Tax=Rubripirellula amarantea TaxID=2527999 RepID=A0A5C5WIB0_9BACT|nr:hypothetical protein Pla22_32110 [Rubripirellula amarantea]